jgi:Na+/H+ antiporter NhaD/arsenite permease-like protein
MNLVKKEWLFFIFLALFFPLYFLTKPTLNEIINSIDFATIRALIALMLITTAMKLSNLFEYFAIKIVNKIKTELQLAYLFIFLAIFLSMFLTNDITLFIVVPLTLSIASILKKDLTKLIIFEAIAVNAGSALTPFGNPQNLFLFRQMNISVIDFIREMKYLFLVELSVLFIFLSTIFKPKTINVSLNKKINVDKFLFVISIILFIVFIIALEKGMVRYALILIVLVFLFKKEIFLKFDYFLIFTFILMFVDFHLLTKLQFIQTLFQGIEFNFKNTFNLTLLLSQIFSNVPATIFLSHFSNNYIAIAYGANLGGNGLIIASFANIIALRFINKGYLKFHKYSIIFLLISYLLISVIFI